MHGLQRKPRLGQTLVCKDGRTLAVDFVTAIPGDSGTFTLPENTAATDVPGAKFTLAAYRGAQFDYVITRGSAITRKGTLHIAGDSAAPSVNDTAAAVGAAGITWSAVVSGGDIQIKIATDNSVATPIRLRWSMTRWTEP
jgi:hypothetical protein